MRNLRAKESAWASARGPRTRLAPQRPPPSRTAVAPRPPSLLHPPGQHPPCIPRRGDLDLRRVALPGDQVERLQAVQHGLKCCRLAAVDIPAGKRERPAGGGRRVRVAKVALI